MMAEHEMGRRNILWKSTVSESQSAMAEILSLYLSLMMSPEPYAASAWRCIP